ncbi:MAG TPA: DUF6151 family protein [Methylocella sp.]|jgi:hypothetical protein|nr:DUF6151 family protein [Methylocella sp.]
MSMNATLYCRCKEVRGLVTNVSPNAVNRVVCYCVDCQAFLHHLGRADLLDAFGGTDIVQIAPASLSFVQGMERIVGLRLTPKGLYRWYASCCRTPLGNTLGPAIPFVGTVAQAFESETQRADDLFGRPIAAIYGKHAVGRVPEGSTRFNLRLIARGIRMVLGWRIRGHTWPHPFFERATRAPSFPLTTLSQQEREALRPLCGPNPSVHFD